MRLAVFLAILIMVTSGQAWSIPDNMWETPQTTRRVCEHDTMHLSCHSGSTLQISDAMYGRTNKDHCKWSLIKCQSSSSLSAVRHRCQGRRTCSVPASNDVFGEPCWAVPKYLEVTYKCFGFLLLASQSPKMRLAVRVLLALAILGTWAQAQEKCLVGNGASYRGTVSVTKTAKTCQRWDRQSPHQHSRAPHDYPYSGLEGNYCRNPDGEPGPWCYTTDPGTRWELCTVPPCIESSLMSRRVCEDDTMYLSCGSGSTMHVSYAMYGRNDKDHCKWSLIKCQSSSSLSDVRGRCQGRSSCSVPASNHVFGDPCWAVPKYLEVTYKCYGFLLLASQSSKRRLTVLLALVMMMTLGQAWSLPDNMWGTPKTTRLACERQTLSLSCRRGLTIRVSYALYGRTRYGVCTEWDAYTTNCRSSSSLPIVKRRCQGRRKCRVAASNDVFGDPCSKTFKYLEVTYTCAAFLLLASQSSKKRLAVFLALAIMVTFGQAWSLPDNMWETPKTTRRACEDQTLSLSCRRGLTIKVSYALYGRTQHGFCGRKVRTTNCRSSSSLSAVKHRCQGRRTCRVAASNDVFGDPCWGTNKYLEVTYTCLGCE
uniref:Kringle domain-containing protein n=1 Tax=Branchiostoma floridae TaxID=7739 RepID=C3YT90_BRAFL|eukprot:XP_002600445.1 hypothetical protein BRAFLDRAFT_109205 [Branchiostoma floridae]